MRQAAMLEELSIDDALKLVGRAGNWFRHSNNLTGFIAGCRIEMIFDPNEKATVTIGLATDNTLCAAYDVEPESKYFAKILKIYNKASSSAVHIFNEGLLNLIDPPHKEAERKACAEKIRNQGEFISYIGSLLK